MRFFLLKKTNMNRLSKGEELAPLHTHIPQWLNGSLAYASYRSSRGNDA